MNYKLHTILDTIINYNTPHVIMSSGRIHYKIHNV